MGKERARNLLALIVVVGAIGYFFFVSTPRFSAKSEPLVIANQAVLGSALMFVLGYFFGASKHPTDNNSKTDKNETL